MLRIKHVWLISVGKLRGICSAHLFFSELTLLNSIINKVVDKDLESLFEVAQWLNHRGGCGVKWPHLIYVTINNVSMHL